MNEPQAIGEPSRIHAHAADSVRPMKSARLLRRSDVLARVGFSKSTLYALVKSGAFPKPRKLSANIVAWVESEVDAWIAARVDAAA